MFAGDKRGFDAQKTCFAGDKRRFDDVRNGFDA
jgi:hypothetical protein